MHQDLEITNHWLANKGAIKKRTAYAAEYPPQLCEHWAEMITRGRLSRNDDAIISKCLPARGDPSSQAKNDDVIPIDHCLTHFPKHRKCRSCIDCKMQRKPHRKQNEKDKDQFKERIRFGSIITLDNVGSIRNEKNHSRKGDATVCCLQDRYTDWIGGYPAPSRSTDAIVWLLITL